MGWSRCRLVAGLVLMAAVWLPAEVFAQEIGFTFGRFLGDDVPVELPLGGAPESLAFAESSIYGGRLGLGLLLVDVEASVTTTNSKLELGADSALDASFLYAEGAVLLKILPGPIQPFLAAGVGLHRIRWGGELAEYTKLGYLVGAGVKLALGSVVLRGDLRDHITPLKLEELDPILVGLLGLPGDKTLHNFELSATLSLRF